MHQLPDAPPDISTIFLVNGTMAIGPDFRIGPNSRLLTLTLTATGCAC